MLAETPFCSVGFGGDKIMCYFFSLSFPIFAIIKAFVPWFKRVFEGPAICVILTESLGPHFAMWDG